MKYAIIAIVVALWLWSYYRIIRLTNSTLRKLYSLQIDIDQVAPQSGRLLLLLLVAPAVYAKIVFSTIRDAIICSNAMFLVWWYKRKGKKEEQK